MSLANHPKTDGVKTSLRLPRIELQARIGAESEERAAPQPLEVDLRVLFTAVPQGCYTGILSDTVCYASLVKAMTCVCAAREYVLLEELTYLLVKAVRDACLPTETRLDLTLTKCFPPIPEAKEGASFRWQEI